MKLKFILYTLYIVCFFISFLTVGSAIDTAYVLGGSIASIIFVILITTISSDYWEYIKKLMNKVFGNEKD
jgi:hypothetical protein